MLQNSAPQNRALQNSAPQNRAISEAVHLKGVELFLKNRLRFFPVSSGFFRFLQLSSAFFRFSSGFFRFFRKNRHFFTLQVLQFCQRQVIQMLKAWFVRWQIQRTINAAWNSCSGAEARQQLFPDGKPSPEEFISVIAKHIKEREQEQGQQQLHVSTLAPVTRKTLSQRS